MTIYEDMYERAIIKTMEKCNTKSEKEIYEKLEMGDCCIHNYFRYNLAYEICDYLASFIENIRCGFIYGSSLTDEFRRNSDINIILHVKELVPGMEDMIREVDEGLTEIYSKALCLDIDECTSLIEITVIDDENIIKNEGITCIMCSVLAPPLKVWECEAHGEAGPKASK